MRRGYAETRTCRRGYLLNFFGEDFAPPCDACDNCLAGRDREEAPAAEPFPTYGRVAHTAWGAGQVMRYEGGRSSPSSMRLATRRSTWRWCWRRGCSQTARSRGECNEGCRRDRVGAPR